LLLVGCSGQTGGEADASSAAPASESVAASPGAPTAPERESRSPVGEPELAPPQATGASQDDTARLAPVPIEGGVAAIGPENTEIQFVGKHTDSRPDRVGVFQAFSGSIEVDSATQAIEAISVEIQTDSLLTPIDRLTNHLKSPDFFEVREYPTATFQSTAVASDGGSASPHRVTGELTVHGVTKEISFPADVRISDGGLTLTSEFVLDRTDFGMNYGPDQVKTEVPMTVTVGRKTELEQAEAGRR
jgi:polyisoprenoid-binding protein YceI